MSMGACSSTRTDSGGDSSDIVDQDVRTQTMQTLFRANARPLRQYLLRLTHGQNETAEDLLQETMLRAWRRVEELPVEAEPLRRWLFTVARNLAIDGARAKLARPIEVAGDGVDWAGFTEGAFEGLLDRHVLRDALLRLTPEQRSVLVALYYRDASVAEAAAGMGIPEGTVRSRSFYALRTVREILSRTA